VINLINVIYVVKDLAGIITYRHTLEYIQVIHLIIQCLKWMVTQSPNVTNILFKLLQIR